MASPPKSVIHINFIAGSLLFDARPIWTALRNAERDGKVPTGLAERLFQDLGGTAIHLGTRHYVMKRAVEDLKSALLDVYNQVPEPWNISAVSGFRVISGNECERARDRVLLAIDAFLFEFRAYLDLLARFVHGVLLALAKGPSRTENLSSGKIVEITHKNGELKPHAFLLYISDKVNVPPGWYEFLSSHRNFFTHEGAPYCAIEDLMVRPPQFDLIVMKANIHDFQLADPADYFRVSECQAVVRGISELSAAAQQYLVDVVLK
jgi:hypothetical protein